MNTRLLLWLAFLWLVSLCSGTQRWRLATWNLHNFFDSVDDRYGDIVPRQDQVDEKVADLVKALEKIGADVVAVQEVEKRALLDRLAQRAGYRYANLVPGNDGVRGINVGLLSKVKVQGYASHLSLITIYMCIRDRGFSR